VDATFEESGGLRVPVTAEAVKNAPHLTGDHLTPEDEAELRRHYGVGSAGTAPVVDETPVAGPPVEPVDAVPTDRTQPVPVDTDGGMVRSEERLVVGTERVATTRARVVKYVVTEEVQITVPIRREEIRIEEVPIDAPDLPGESLLDDGRSGSDDTAGTTMGTAVDGGLPDEIILHTERPVVTVEVVPVERVRLRTEVVQGQETITEQVQREQIAVDQHAVPRTTARHAATGDTGV
jgi:stress response protein YsnF